MTRLRISDLCVLTTLVVVLAPTCPEAAGQAAASPSDPVQATLAAERSRVALVERLSKAVCAIFPSVSEGAPAAAPLGSGSGVLISADGWALTNYHVAGEAERLNVGLSDGKVYAAAVKGRDPTGDIALIKVEGGPFSFAELGDSDALAVGDWVFAMGNPFGLATDFVPTVTQGVVSGLHRYLPGTMGGDLIYTDCIQIDAPINPGNSGGPLFDRGGRLVGINGRVSVRPSRGKVNSGVGFAIPINQIKEFLPDLRSGGRVHHAVLGVEISEGAADVTVKTVLPGSAADKAGLQTGDIVRKFQGHEVRSETELINRIGVLPAGKRARIVLERAGRQYDLEVVLDERPTSGETARPTPATPEAAPKPVETPARGDDSSPEEILRRYVEALGGSDALDSIRDTITTGRTRRLLMGSVWVDGRITHYEIGASRFRMETVLSYRGNTSRQVTVYAGSSGWIYGDGRLVEMTPETLAAMQAEVEAFDRLTKRDGWRTEQARSAGPETLDGRKVLVVVTRDRLGTERRWSFDAETGLLSRLVYRDGTGQTLDSRINDYRRVGGVQHPFQFTRYVNGAQTQTTQIESIELNRGIKEETLRERPPVTIGPKVY